MRVVLTVQIRPSNTIFCAEYFYVVFDIIVLLGRQSLVCVFSPCLSWSEGCKQGENADA